jgi:hypothetical protein
MKEKYLTLQGLMVFSVTKGATQKLPKKFEMVETYRHDHSLESSCQHSDGPISFLGGKCNLWISFKTPPSLCNYQCTSCTPPPPQGFDTFTTWPINLRAKLRHAFTQVGIQDRQVITSYLNTCQDIRLISTRVHWRPRLRGKAYDTGCI